MAAIAFERTGSHRARLALCQQRAAGKQLFFCGDGALDGAVINEHIGVFDAGVKVLQRDIHGGKAVAAVGKVCKNGSYEP